MSLTPNDRVPPELWIETFKDPDLSCDDLQALCLTNRSFAHLARPFLFSDFRFRAYVAESHAGELVLLLPNAKVVRRNLQRLEFWLSDTIAPLVRTCEIETWNRRGRIPEDGPFITVTSDNRDGMLGPLIARLERFSGVQRLSFWGLEIGGDLLLKVSQMLSLHELKVEACTMKDVVPSSSPRITDGPHISRVVFGGPRNGVQGMDMQPWTRAPFLDPRYLRTLNTGCGFRSWFDNPQAVPVFPLVTELSIPIAPSEQPQNFREILPKFPAVEVLEITGRSDRAGSSLLQDISAGSQGLVALKELVLFASIDILPIFLSPVATTSLTHLTLDDRSTSAARLLEKLPQTPLSGVFSLAFTLSENGPPAVRPILTRFPNVRELRVDLHRRLYGTELARHSENPFALTLFNDIARSGVLSSDIVSIALRHSFSTGFEFRTESPPQRQVGLDELALLRDAFISRYSKLTSLILHGGAFCVKWSRDTGGYVAEYMTNDVDEAGIIWDREYEWGFRNGSTSAEM
ncbi:hypothetical protein C8F01DRAFT_1369299 [Mycena amicta]|nr:hypothetical protein C8F01DRAFT_1369299 [Mycena amicta]